MHMDSCFKTYCSASLHCQARVHFIADLWLITDNFVEHWLGRWSSVLLHHPAEYVRWQSSL